MLELTKIFGLSPSHQVTTTSESFLFVPIQIMETLLQPILSLEPYDSTGIQSIMHTDTSNMAFIPSINTVMCGDKGVRACPLSMPIKDSHRTLIHVIKRYTSHN